MGNTDSVMSSDLIWLCVRNNNCFLKKRNGAMFTSEPNNLANLSSYKYSGLANRKTVGLDGTHKGVVLTTKSTKGSNARKPNKLHTKTLLKRDVKRVVRSVKAATTNYRPDLEAAASARPVALLGAKRRKDLGVKPKPKRERKSAN